MKAAIPLRHFGVSLFLATLAAMIATYSDWDKGLFNNILLVIMLITSALTFVVHGIKLTIFLRHVDSNNLAILVNNTEN
jgi:hypothetical protein